MYFAKRELKDVVMLSCVENNLFLIVGENWLSKVFGFIHQEQFFKVKNVDEDNKIVIGYEPISGLSAIPIETIKLNHELKREFFVLLKECDNINLFTRSGKIKKYKDTK